MTDCRADGLCCQQAPGSSGQSRQPRRASRAGTAARGPDHCAAWRRLSGGDGHASYTDVCLPTNCAPVCACSSRPRWRSLPAGRRACPGSVAWAPAARAPASSPRSPRPRWDRAPGGPAPPRRARWGDGCLGVYCSRGRGRPAVEVLLFTLVRELQRVAACVRL